MCRRATLNAVSAQYDGTEQINSIAILHVLLGLAIFCAMYLCCVLCLDIIFTIRGAGKVSGQGGQTFV